MRLSNSSCLVLTRLLLLLVLLLLTPGLVEAFRISPPRAQGGWARVQQDPRRSALAATMSDDEQEQVRVG